MKQSTCERCGKEFDYHAGTKMFVGVLYPDNCNTIALCPDCQKELQTWMEKGVNNED